MSNSNEHKKIIEKYNKIIKDFHDRVKRDVFPELEKQRKKYDFILTKLNSFYYITNYISTNGGMKTNIVYDNALFTIYNKAALDLFGIFHCLYNGLEIQASIIFRSLYELYVYNDFIFKEDTEERIRLLYNFQFVERWNHIQNSMKNNLNYLEEMKIDKDSFEQYKNDYELYKKDYHPKYPIHWAYKIFKDRFKGSKKGKNPNLFDICKYLGDNYVKVYISNYGTSSKQTHTSSILGDYFTVSERKGNVSINSPMYKDSIVSLCVMSIIYCGKIILDIINYFKIDNLDELSIYINHYVDVMVSEGSNYKDYK